MFIIPFAFTQGDVTLDTFVELRRAYNATLKANLTCCPNVQCAENENLAGNGSEICEPDHQARVEEEGHSKWVHGGVLKIRGLLLCSFSRYFTDVSAQLNSSGMRKLARNWEQLLKRISRSSDGQLVVRRASSDSSVSTSSGGAIGACLNKHSSDARAPWKPY